MIMLMLQLVASVSQSVVYGLLGCMLAVFEEDTLGDLQVCNILRGAHGGLVGRAAGVPTVDWWWGGPHWIGWRPTGTFFSGATV